MTHVTFRTCLAVLAGLILAATGAWAAGEEEQPAAAMEKVLHPTTGEMVTAPEYGGTLTFAIQRPPPHPDVCCGSGASRGADGVLEKLGIVNWGIDRDEYDITGAFNYVPTSALTGRLAESWELPDALTYVFNLRPGVRWHDKAPMNGRELTAEDVVFSFHRVSGTGSGFTEPPAGYAGKYMEQAPWLALWPGLCLTITVYSLNMFGDAVRDLLDPRLRGGGGRLGTHGGRRSQSRSGRSRSPRSGPSHAERFMI